jgi:transposase-like protein
MSVADACKELGVGPTQFANLREQMLQGALDALEPRPVGRPSKSVAPTREGVDDLEDEIVELDQENALLRAKVEVNEALRARGASKSPTDGKPSKKRPRGRG